MDQLDTLLTAVRDADARLTKDVLCEAQRLFLRCVSEPACLQQVRERAPEYERPEFLLCVDRRGHASGTGAELVDHFLRTSARYPEFGRWFCHAVMPGSDLGVLLVARWLCHLVAFRHRTVHLFLDHPVLANHTLIQVRAVTKSEAPGCFDLPVAGHVDGLDSIEDTLFKELAEELGLMPDAVIGLTRLGEYEQRHPPDRSGLNNVEHHVVFHGQLSVPGWLQVSAADHEVAAIAAFDLDDLVALLDHFPERVARGLKGSLPLYVRR